MPAAIPAAIAAGTALVGAASSRQAASQAADARQRASEEAAVARGEDLARLEPWRQSGEQANNRLAAMLGLNGQATPFNSDDPGYAFRLSEGQRQVDNSAAARGSTLSGGALKALQKYGQGMASQEFQNSYNRLANVSAQGQNAATGQGSASMQFNTLQNANTNAMGDARAAGTIGQGNAWANAGQTAVNQYQNNQMMDLFRNQQSGYGGSSGYGSPGMNSHFYGNGTGGD